MSDITIDQRVSKFVEQMKANGESDEDCEDCKKRAKELLSSAPPPAELGLECFLCGLIVSVDGWFCNPHGLCGMCTSLHCTNTKTSPHADAIQAYFAIHRRKLCASGERDDPRVGIYGGSRPTASTNYDRIPRIVQEMERIVRGRRQQ